MRLSTNLLAVIGRDVKPGLTLKKNREGADSQRPPGHQPKASMTPQALCNSWSYWSFAYLISIIFCVCVKSIASKRMK